MRTARETEADDPDTRYGGTAREVADEGPEVVGDGPARVGGEGAELRVVVAGSDRMDCTFCRLIREDAARWVTRGPVVSAFVPLDPLAPGHTLVVPTSHWTDIFDAPPQVLAQAMTLVQLLAEKMRSELKAGGVNILSASGPGSEQSVPHLHFHVVPRWSDDAFTTWPAHQSRHRFVGDPVTQLANAMAAIDTT